MVEAIALPVAAETFAEILNGKRKIWLIDSDPVLVAAVKGYSAQEDICTVIGAF